MKEDSLDESLDHEVALAPPPYPSNTIRPSPVRQIKDPTISHRDFFILDLHLKGAKAEEIAELVGFKNPASVYNVLRKKEMHLVRQLLLEGLELEFEVLQKEVFEVIEEALKEPDPRVRLEAVDKWFRYFGKYKVKEDKEKEITAEDVVKKLLQVNVQVNVGDKRNGGNGNIK